MNRAWSAFLLIAGCSTRPNPLYCDENADCANGTLCNLETHGCELAADASPDDGPEMDGPFVARTVQEVRAASTPENTPVELVGVVITAVDEHGSVKGEFWVQDAGGGPASGVHVYGAIATEVEQLSIGDVVDIGNARKVVFTPVGDTSGRTEIELLPRVGGNLAITKTGTDSPIWTDMDVVAIGMLTQPQLDLEREKWAGMLVRVTQIRADGPPFNVTSVQHVTIGPVDVTDLHVDLPSGIVAGTCFDEVIGVVEYAKSYNVIPRHTNDITIGTSCP